MRNTAKGVWLCLLVLGVMLTSWTGAFAQTYTATVTGTVTDPQGAAVPNVKVVATNQGTKLEYTAVTSDAGVYTIPFLPVGSYVLSIEATGFKKLVSNEVKLEVNQAARINLQLQVGAVNEVVNVTDVAPILQTESVTVGNVISANTTVSLPLNGRSFQQLALLVPGAITPNPTSFTTPQPNTGGGRPFVNGNREQGNAFLLDGISVDETLDNLIGYKPNIDAIQEFRVETSNSSAEFGNVTGATVNATLKSGTNDFRGNVFEFLRNEALDANSWGNNRQKALTGVAVPKNKLRQSIFGGTLGGPVLKNRLFFFTDYQGAVQRTGGPGSVRVASPAWRTGNLSTLSPYIRDPQKPRTQLCQATPATPAAGVNYQEACFPGAIIPANRIVNPVAKALFADPTLYPLPDRIDPSNGTGIKDVVTANTYDGHQFDVRVDARATERDNVSVRYSFGNYETLGAKGALPVVLTGKSFSRPQNVAINWTSTISPTLINEARIGLNRAVFFSEGYDWANIGKANAKAGIPGDQIRTGLSAVTLGNGLTGIGNSLTDSFNSTNTFHYGDNLTWLRGRHALKMGAQLQHYQQNRYYAGNNGRLGFFTYTSTFTGQVFSDFLLDQLSNKGIGGVVGTNKGTWGHRQNRWGIFIQDDYKVRNNLTVNLGMRWEYTSPVVEVADRQANFDIKTGAIQLAGKNGNSRALYNPYYKGFEPRIGIAWTPDMFNGKFVVRAGYGITQYMEGTGSNLRLPLNPPFFAEADIPYDLSSGAGTITKGFTDVIVRDKPFGQIRIWNPDLRPQFTQQWNLTLEYQLFKNTSVTAGYVGHWATHLVAPTDVNQPLPGTGPASGWAAAQTRRPLYSIYPDVTQTSVTDSWAISRYHSLQLSARQRFSKGLEFLASYTLSKTMTNNLGYYGSGGVATQSAYSGNAYDRSYNYGPAFFDARHNVVLSSTYDLPFGKGRTFGKNWNPIVNAVIGGWNFGNIFQIRTGFPMTINLGQARSLQAPRGSERPNTIAPVTTSSSTPDCYIPNPNNRFCPSGSVSSFSLPDLGTFGSTGVGTVYAPGFFNWDASIGKKFYWTEHKYFDFRAEFFNFTNHPSFAAPDRTWTQTSTTFGQITGVVSPPRNLEFALKFHF